MIHTAQLNPFGPPEEMVGRGRELDSLRFLIRETGGPLGTPLLLSGEPGVGKTALLASACRHAIDEGFRVLSAQGSEFEANIGYSSLQQLLLHACLAAGREPDDRLTALRIVLGIDSGGQPPVDRVADSVASLLTALAREHPVLIAIDDAHWADRSSSEVLARIVTRRLTGNAPVGLLSTARVRPDGGLIALPYLTVLPVNPLSDSASEELLLRSCPALAGDRRSAVLAAAHGNPLALLELARSCTESASSDAPPGPLSYPLMEAFGSGIETLDERTRRLALLAALDDHGTAAAALFASAGRIAAERLPSARRSTSVLVEGARGIHFQHPLTARAIVQQASRAEIREAHRALGLNYAQDPRSLERAARHLTEGATTPDGEAADVLEQLAATFLDRGDVRTAIESLLRASSLSEKATDRTRRISQAALMSCEAAGDLASTERILTAASAADPGFRTSLAGATAAAAALLLGDGDVDTAHRLLISAIENYPHREAAHDPVLISALTTWNTICWYGGRAELWASYRTAVERLRPAVPTALYVSTYTYSDPARVTPAVHTALMDQIAALETTSDPLMAIRIGMAAAHFDRIVDLRPTLTRMADNGRRGGAVIPAINAMYLMGLDDMDRGDWVSSRALVVEGIELAEQHGYRMIAWSGHCQLARLSAAEGKEDELADSLARLEYSALPRHLHGLTMYIHYANALAASGRGDFRTAFRHAEMLSPPGVFAPFASIAPLASYELVEAAVRTGRHETALAHARAVRSTGMATWSPRWKLIAASCLALAEDTEPSIERLRAVVAAEESARSPFDKARAHYVIGAYLRRHNQFVDSRSHLAAAARTFAELGATSWAGRAEAELAATALVRQRSGASGAEALSPQERHVVELAAEGSSTKQIAERLGISPRTVSNHLYRAFPKLGVHSRAGLRHALSD